jgi:hypothetical protein
VYRPALKLELSYLGLAETRVTNAGVEHLADLSTSEWLTLDRTRITDAGLRCLEQMPRLKALDISGTATSPQGINRLPRALPGCKIQAAHPLYADENR